MNPNLWDDYAPGEVNDKIRFWVDLWESLLDNLSDPALGLVFMNPHLLLRHIIDEIVFNNFRNPENRAYFQQQLDLFAKTDPATRKLFSSDIALIRREFGGTRSAYLLQLCRLLDSEYSKNSYLDELFSSLRAVFGAPEWQSDDELSIRTIVQCMIVELHLRGYSLDTIKRLPASIFNRTAGLLIFDHFPTSVREADFIQNGQLDYAAYRNAVQSEIDALTIESRLNAFRNCFNPKTTTSYFIFQVEGLKGDDVDVSLGDVNLYSPKKKRYIKTIPGTNPESLLNEELFGRPEDACFANAAVRVLEFDTHASVPQAIALIEKALDLFRTYVLADVPFRVVPYHYIRVSLEGEYWGKGERGPRREDSAYKHYRSINLTELTKLAINEGFLRSAGEQLFSNRSRAPSALRIAHSLHWYRKAEETEVPEDRLLGYWIVLENIVSVERSESNVLLPEKAKESKFSLIREIVPALEACHFLESSMVGLYRYLVGLLNSTTNGRRLLTLPHDVASRALLDVPAGVPVNIATFASQLGMVADAIDSRVVKSAVVSVLKLHTDAESAKSEIAARVRSTKDELLMIYSLRNRIVHNAHYDNTLLPFYIEKARRYAGNTVRQVLHDVCVGRERSIEESLLRYHVSLARMQERLEKGILVNFLEWDF